MAENLGPAATQRLRAAVESSPNGLLMIDDGGHIVLVNREIERLFGYEREELLGKSVELLVPARFQEHHPAYRQNFAQHPRVRAMGAGGISSVVTRTAPRCPSRSASRRW